MRGLSQDPRRPDNADIGARRGLRRGLAVVVLTVALALAVAACGSSSSAPASGTQTGTTHLAKTKFVLHAGLAFGAFHHWIYKPLKAGALTHPFTHKVATIKAALAAAFVYHELKLALADAQADPTLSKLVAPITALQNRMNGVGSSLKSGHVDSAGIDQANGSVGSIHSGAAAAGQPITETSPAAP